MKSIITIAISIISIGLIGGCSYDMSSFQKGQGQDSGIDTTPITTGTGGTLIGTSLGTGGSTSTTTTITSTGGQTIDSGVPGTGGEIGIDSGFGGSPEVGATTVVTGTGGGGQGTGGATGFGGTTVVTGTGGQGTGGSTGPYSYTPKTVPAGKKILIVTSSPTFTPTVKNALVSHFTSRGLGVDVARWWNSMYFTDDAHTQNVVFSSYGVALVLESRAISNLEMGATSIESPTIVIAGHYGTSYITSKDHPGCSVSDNLVISDPQSPLAGGYTANILDNASTTGCAMVNSNAHVAMVGDYIPPGLVSGAMLFYYDKGAILPEGTTTQFLRIGFPVGVDSDMSEWDRYPTTYPIFFNLLDASVDFALGL